MYCTKSVVLAIVFITLYYYTFIHILRSLSSIFSMA